MNKTNLIDCIVAETGLKKKDVETTVNASFAAIIKALANGEKVQLAGFGSFDVKQRAQREGRNPATGAPMTIPASKGVGFSASKVLKDSVNK